VSTSTLGISSSAPAADPAGAGEAPRAEAEPSPEPDVAAQLDDFVETDEHGRAIRPEPVRPAAKAARPRSSRQLLAKMLIVPAVVASVATGGAYASMRATAPEPPTPLGPGEVTIEMGIAHSLFEDEEIRVYDGTRVRFVLDNGDPINHELIMGDAAVHARHAAGHEARHAPIPGEVSVSPNDRAVTTFRFDEPGTVEFACHLPGHYEYGMHGTIEVVARA
jgi:uncharacterized cupredoxin-like copper-binding protein